VTSGQKSDMKDIKDKLLRYCDWLIGAFLVLFVFWSPISITGTQIAVSFALLFWVVRMFGTRKFHFVRNPLNIPIAAFLAAAAIGVITAIDFRHSLRGYMTLGWMSIFFLTVNNVKDKNQFKRLLSILFIFTSIAAAYGIWQSLTKMDFMHTAKGLHAGLPRSTGFFNHYMTFAGYLNMVFPLTFGLVLFGSAKSSFGELRRGLQKSQLILGLAGLLMLVALVFTYTRGAWIGFLAGLIFMGVLRSRKVLFISLGAIILIVVTLAVFPRSSVSRRAASIFNPASTDRLSMWKSSLKIVKDYALTGVGWESFGKIYPEYISPGTYRSPHAHNNFLNVAVESGMLGLGIFLWLLIVILKVGVSIFKRVQDGYLKGISLGFLGGFVAFVIHGLTEYNFGDSEVVMLFYFLLGMVMVIPRIVGSNKE
jgi:O-antigen ligase